MVSFYFSRKNIFIDAQDGLMGVGCWVFGNVEEGKLVG